ncbi:MAG: hypothetical protein G01um1014106_618 [Parcubacteria group bacterium Gr01-1014_106]|nr:MAG: hypothetical protein G01um1014106_618 [Parcubacteria group bacterium Gr01-1014_106]
MEKSIRPRVAIVHGRDRRENIRQAQALLGDAYIDRLKSARQIFIHPNLVSDTNQLASTHVEAVRAILDVISLHRGDTVRIGDASYHSTKKAFERFDYASLQRSGNAQLLDLNDDETLETCTYDRELRRQPVPASKTVLSSDCILLVVPPKMHSYYTVTLSLKTHVVGSMVVPKSPFGIHARWPHVHSGYSAAHRTLADWYQEHPAHAAFIDGREAMEGNGPTSGTKVELNWAVASLDPVAADAVAAWLMGFAPDDIGYLVFLREAGWTIDPDAMEIVGEPHWRELRQELARPETWPEIAEWNTHA